VKAFTPHHGFIDYNSEKYIEEINITITITTKTGMGTKEAKHVKREQRKS